MYINIHTHKISDGKNISIRNLKLNEKIDLNENEFLSIGIHPWEIENLDLLNELPKIEKLISENKQIIALGEIGLDRFIHTDFAKQIDTFEKQLELSVKHQLNCIIHCTKAYSDLLNIRKKYNSIWIFHGYNENEIIAKKLIDSDCFLSFGSNLLNEKNKIRNVFKTMPLERIFIETDDSEIEIEEIYSVAAQIKNVEIDYLKYIIEENFKHCFNSKINKSSL